MGRELSINDICFPSPKSRRGVRGEVKTMQEKVQKIIDQVKPYIVMHGGDVSLVDIVEADPSTGSGLIVKLKVSGACVGCSFSNETFNGMIGGMIKEEIPEVKEIIITN